MHPIFEKGEWQDERSKVFCIYREQHRERIYWECSLSNMVWSKGKGLGIT